MQDIANSNTGGYFVNPVSDKANSLISLMADIQNLANSANITSIYDTANTINNSQSIIYFREHTDRLSGVTPLDANANNVLLPHYENCIGIGKALSYLVYQSDGISNNAVIMGNFGSLYTGNTLDSYIITLTTDKNLIQTYGNTLSPTQVSTIVGDMTTLNSYITTSVTTDVNYYANCRSVVNDYNSVKGFTRPGDTEKYLYTIIASDKLKERI